MPLHATVEHRSADLIPDYRVQVRYLGLNGREGRLLSVCLPALSYEHAKAMAAAINCERVDYDPSKDDGKPLERE